MRARILLRDGNQCRLCFRSEGLDAHHIVPQCQGGKSVEENGITLCEECHPLIKNSEIDFVKILSYPPGTLPEL